MIIACPVREKEIFGHGIRIQVTDERLLCPQWETKVNYLSLSHICAMTYVI